LNKREQAIVKREKVVNDWIDAELKPVLKCFSHNIKSWEDAEAKRKNDGAGKGQTDQKDQTEIELEVLWKITNLNKQISIFFRYFPL